MAHPYVDTLTTALRAVALGETPPGFDLRPFQPGDPLPACAWPGVELTPGQILEGQQLIITVAVACYAGTGSVELAETACAGDRVAAVAAWPHSRLAAGAATEVYVVTRRRWPEEPTAAPRPSLLGGSP
jgi:hypothetical protein